MKMIVVIIIIILVCGVLTISCCSLISLLSGGGIFLSLENEKQGEENKNQEKENENQEKENENQEKENENQEVTNQPTSPSPISSISNVSKTTLHKLVKKYYDEKMNTHEMETIEDSNVVSSNVLDVRFKYKYYSKLYRMKFTSGPDYRRFVFSLSPLEVTKMKDWKSGKTVAPDSDK